MTVNWNKLEMKKTHLMMALIMLGGLTLAFSMPIARMHIDPTVVFASVLTESGTQLFFENTLAFLAETSTRTTRSHCRRALTSSATATAKCAGG